MNEDYEHFFCWYSEDMYKVQLRLKIYRELQKVVNGGSLCETLGWLNHTVGCFTDDLLCGSVQNHSTNASYNGYTDTMEKMLERLRMDLEYLRDRSLWLDLKIIYLTVMSILTGKKF